MDYKAFLARPESLVLPYFGGTRVDTATRRHRVAAAIEPGWWRFEIDGRRAVPVEPAASVDLGALPALRGHWADGWIVVSGRELGRIALPPEDEPAPLARVTARRWYSGELLLESIDFEDSAEVAARDALEARGSIGGLRDVVPSLRYAFSFALATAIARAEGVHVSLRELAPHITAISDGGPAAAVALLDRIAAARRAAEAEARERILRAEAAAREVARAERARTAVASAHVRDRPHGSPNARVDAVLEAAGARMLSCRRLSGSQLEVRLTVDDTRIIATIAADSLQVLDSGICLSGADREITLDSLPSVVHEAIDTGRLVITRN